MTPDDLKDLLRAWGRWYGERVVFDDSTPQTHGPHGYGTNPIATGMQFAPSKRSSVVRQRTNMDRGGQGRRRLMAAGAGCGMRILPASYVDPVPCRQTRPAVFGMGERARPEPKELQRVELAALDLMRIDTTRGVCLRVHYCTLGELVDKATLAGLRIGTTIPVRAYRNTVSEARFWMLGRLSGSP